MVRHLLYMVKGTRATSVLVAPKDIRSTILEFESDPSGGGLVRIKGQATNKYLCFSLKGKLIDRTVGKSKKCLFRETEIGGYIELISAANCRWKVGFNKRGKRMSGAFQQKTKRQDCYKFKKEKCSSCERNQDYTSHFGSVLAVYELFFQCGTRTVIIFNSTTKQAHLVGVTQLTKDIFNTIDSI
ncbi:Fibroblast growth factor 18 [Bulinus truncatus]|nr:Fibroblast growth factor 18 [Bulinus truncatus]